MYYYVASESPNEWSEPSNLELSNIEHCVENMSEQHYEDTGTSGEVHKMMCNYHRCIWKQGEDPDIFCSIQDWSTGLNRKVIWSESQLSELPTHKGAKKIKV